jgi:hypothetical protein
VYDAGSEPVESTTITTREQFETVLRALVLAADAGGVDVRGGWEATPADADEGWDVHVTALDPGAGE